MTTPQPFLHDDTGAVRCWVDVDGHDQPLATYQAHSAALHAAVRRRVAGGSIEPVMLREFDLRPTAG